MKIYDKEFLEKDFEESYAKLNEFLDVPGMLELRDLLVSFRTNEEYIFLSENIDDDYYNLARRSRKKFKMLNTSAEGLGLFMSMFISKAQISWTSFIAIYSVMMFSCATKFKRQITDEEFMKILSSDIPFKLSIGFDNWFNVQDISVLDKKFFKNLLKIKWTKEAKKTHKAIHEGYWLSLSMEYGIKSKVNTCFSLSADYLSCCYAFSEGRNEILPEDQVRAWTLILNLFLADLRPYIFGGDY